MVSETGTVQIDQESLNGLASCSARSFDNYLDLGYRTTAFAPPRKRPYSFAQHPPLHHLRKPSSSPSRRPVFDSTLKVKSQARHMAMANRTSQLFSLVAGVVHVIRPGHVVAYLLSSLRRFTLYEGSTV